MKKLLLPFLSLFIISLNAFSQDTIPNALFERWEKTGSYWKIDQWSTPNPYLGINPFNTEFTVNKTSDAYQGSAAVLMETKYISWMGLTIPGAITNGDFLLNSSNEVEFVGGSPFSERPDYVGGYYKYSPGTLGADSGGLILYLFKNNSSTGKKDTIGFASLAIVDSVKTYTAFKAEITYYSTENPDTMQLIFSSSAAPTPVQGSTLYIDSIFTGYNVGFRERYYTFPLYPNPTWGKVYCKRPGIKKAIVYSRTGRTVLSVKMNEGVMDVSRLEPGIYIVRLQTRYGNFFERLIIGN